MMADKWLTDTPGCLATFAIRTGQPDDYPVLDEELAGAARPQGRDQALHHRALERRA